VVIYIGVTDIEMVSKTNKGNRIELMARKELEADGYLCDRKNSSRWASNDFFGLFDILAIGKHTKLIQIKSNRSDFYKARKEIQEWVNENKIKGVIFEIWLKEPRIAWRREKVKPQNPTGSVLTR